MSFIRQATEAVRGRALLGAVLALLALLPVAGAPAAAPQVVVSPRPDGVGVTVYRDQGRGAGDGFDREWLGGYALITERRRIRVAAGESEIRFEGVASGLIPQSAIVSGLPEGIVERNRDAYLLSPGTLVDRSLGRRVRLRRTSLATGAVRETDAVIRTGAEGAVVLQTAEGFEALRCTGLPQTLVYDSVPEGLSARPTLSVRARATQPVDAVVTLSYLATGFDWQANYIVQVAPNGRRADIFAWLTMASNDETSFPDADAQAVAGQINRERVEPQTVEGPPLELRCWPQATTSDIPLRELDRGPPLPSLPMDYIESAETIVVTGHRIQYPDFSSSSPLAVVSDMEARLEQLGAVKLYRIPERVTVAANAQKQVALLTRPGVRVETVYRGGFGDHSEVGAGRPATRMLVTRNRSEEGLGLPLPAGPAAIFVEREGRPFLLGEGVLDDRAVGEDVELALGPAPEIATSVRLVRRVGDVEHFELTVTSDRRHPVTYEAELYFAESRLRSRARLGRRDGHAFWRATLPANGRRVLRFQVDRTPLSARDDCEETSDDAERTCEPAD
jgi:hypothetical protein